MCDQSTTVAVYAVADKLMKLQLTVSLSFLSGKLIQIFFLLKSPVLPSLKLHNLLRKIILKEKLLKKQSSITI